MKSLIRVAAFAVAACTVGVAHAQSDAYPSKPIHLVVPFTPGLLSTQARVIANVLQTRLKVPVLIEHKPGANAFVGANAVAASPADGYTLIYFVPAQLSSVFVKDPPWDVQKAFAPVGSVWVGPLLFATNNQVPGKSVADFIAFVKANPAKANYASTTGATNLAMETFKRLNGMQMEKIDYKGSVDAVTALMTNDVQAFFGGAQTILGQARAGKIRALAVAGDVRLPGAPDIPTFAELGYPGMKSSITTVVMAPAGVPHTVVAKLAPLIKEAVETEEMKKLLLDNGVPLSVEPNRLSKFIADEIEFWNDAAKLSRYVPQI